MVGVVLVVAVTAVLGAVLGAAVLDLGGERSAVPQVSLAFEYDGTTVTITHQGGDPVEADRLTVVETGATDDVTVDGSQAVTAGEVLASGSYEAGETIEVVWRGPEGDASRVLADSTAPA